MQCCICSCTCLWLRSCFCLYLCSWLGLCGCSAYVYHCKTHITIYTISTYHTVYVYGAHCFCIAYNYNQSKCKYMMNCMGASSMLLLLIVLILLHSSHCKTCNSNSDNSIISSSKNNNRKDKQVISTSSLALYKNSIRHSSLISIVGSNSVRKGASSIVCKSKGNAANDIQLFKVNILMFFFYATLGSCLPYLPLYFRYLGLNDHDVGLLGSITPAITFIVSPLWGGLADKTRRPKLIMLITFITTIITRTCLIFDYTNNIKMISIVLVVILTAVLNAPVKPLMDNTVMDLLKEKSDYGRSRLYGQIGFGVGSSLVSPFISSNMRWIFYVQILLSIPTTILMFLQPDDPGTGVTVVTQTNSSDNKGSKSISRSEQRKMKNDLKLKKAFMSTLIQPKVVLFFLITFIIGNL